MYCSVGVATLLFNWFLRQTFNIQKEIHSWISLTKTFFFNTFNNLLLILYVENLLIRNFFKFKNSEQITRNGWVFNDNKNQGQPSIVLYAILTCSACCSFFVFAVTAVLFKLILMRNYCSFCCCFSCTAVAAAWICRLL